MSWNPPLPPPSPEATARPAGRGLQRRFLKLPVWCWLVGLVGFAAVSVVLPDPDDDVLSEAPTTSVSTTNPATTVSPQPTVTAAPEPAAVVAATAPAPATAPVATPVATQAPTTTVPGSVRALDVLNFVTVENEHRSDYDRELFGYPGDPDGNGCDTRDEVLVRESLTPAQTDATGCTVLAGEWRSLYDDTTWSDPRDVQIDHVVALKEAWDSGAWAWHTSDLERFGNDVVDARTLRVVSAAANESKGDADPSNWIPPNEAAVCQYLADWVAIKVRWTLSMDESEFGRIRNLLTDRCPEQLIGPWPDTPPPQPTLPPTTTAAPTTAAPTTTTTAPPPPPPVTQPFFPQTPSGGDCDPSYPGVCIPPAPPDLDCGDISFRRFTVIGSDPHRFDGDNDGIGCESD